MCAYEYMYASAYLNVWACLYECVRASVYDLTRFKIKSKQPDHISPADAVVYHVYLLRIQIPLLTASIQVHRLSVYVTKQKKMFRLD